MSRRILYFCPCRSFNVNRLGRKIAGVADSWRSRGHEVLLVCGDDVNDAACGEQSPRPTMTKQEYYDKWYRRSRWLAPVVNSVAEYRDLRHNKRLLDYLRRQAKEFRPDLIWERSSRLHNAGLVVARELQIPYVLEWKDHLIPYRFSWYHRRAVAMEEQKNRQADCVVVESEVLRGQLAAEGVDRDKIFVAHNAVDPEEFRHDPALRQEGRRRLGVADDEVLAGYLGSYAFYHDSERLVLAADLLRRQAGHKLRILMIGDGKDFPKCRAMAERLGLLDSGLLMMKPRIPKEEVPGVLAALDVAVLPGSTDIICPIKVQEYMAAELPTALPDYPVNREVVVHRKTGMLFRPKDERSLAAALADLAADADLRRRMGQTARKDVSTRFTWEKTWGAALEHILQRLGGAPLNKGLTR